VIFRYILGFIILGFGITSIFLGQVFMGVQQILFALLYFVNTETLRLLNQATDENRVLRFMVSTERDEDS